MTRPKLFQVSASCTTPGRRPPTMRRRPRDEGRWIMEFIDKGTTVIHNSSRSLPAALFRFFQYGPMFWSHFVFYLLAFWLVDVDLHSNVSFHVHVRFIEIDPNLWTWSLIVNIEMDFDYQLDFVRHQNRRKCICISSTAHSILRLKNKLGTFAFVAIKLYYPICWLKWARQETNGN